MVQPISSFPGEELTQFAKAKLDEPKEIYLDYGPALPDKYCHDKIAALVRDPLCVFTYWELSGSRIQEAIKTIGEPALKQARWVIRLYNRSQDLFTDVNIPVPETLDCVKGNWYFNSLQPDTKYQLEIGMITAAGSFILLAQSNIVLTPRLGFAIDQVQPEIYFYLR
jgi:hypothetical protein